MDPSCHLGGCRWVIQNKSRRAVDCLYHRSHSVIVSGSVFMWFKGYLHPLCSLSVCVFLAYFRRSSTAEPSSSCPIEYTLSCVKNKGALRGTEGRLLRRGPESGIVDGDSPSISLPYIDSPGYKRTNTCAYVVSTESVSHQLGSCLVAHYLFPTSRGRINHYFQVPFGFRTSRPISRNLIIYFYQVVAHSHTSIIIITKDVY